MKNMIAGFLAALGLGLGSCASGKHISSVGADEFETAITDSSVQLVDVRTAEEYAAGHIASAVNMDVQQPGFSDSVQSGLDKSKPAYVYCRSGRRSLVAAEILGKAGFRVVNLRGGIMEWEDAGKPVSR